MLTAFAFEQARPRKEKELEDILLMLEAHTSQETGCINYDLHQHMDRPGKFAFYENWVDKAVLEQHRASPHTRLRLSAQRRAGLSLGHWKSNCSRWSPRKSGKSEELNPTSLIVAILKSNMAIDEIMKLNTSLRNLNYGASRVKRRAI